METTHDDAGYADVQVDPTMGDDNGGYLDVNETELEDPEGLYEDGGDDV